MRCLRKKVGAITLGGCLAVAAPALVASGQTPSPEFAITAPYQLAGAIAPPSGDKITSFDISWVDGVSHTYALANRTSKDVIGVNTLNNTLIFDYKPGFAGFTGSNDTSGPDGVLIAGDEIWVGDAPSQVWVLNRLTGVPVVAPISTSPTSKNRADELCFDPKDHIIAVVNNADSPPFITFISQTDYTVTGQVVFDGNAGRPLATNGAEQCAWNPRDGMIYLSIPEVNGAGDNSSPGAVVVFDPVSRAIQRVMSIPLAACTGPQGLTIGPAPQIGLGCNVGVINGNSAANEAIISDAGAVIASFPNMGGADEIWYDPGNNKYFEAARQAPGGEALFIIDASTFAVQRLFTGTGSNAHSVAVDPFTNVAYVPTSSAATSGLCSSKGAVDANGCILVFAPAPQLTAATHDFNGDGKSDILWRDTSGNIAMWLMNGASISSSSNVGNFPTVWSIVSQRDFNGDGKADILLMDTSGDVAMLFMNGPTITSSALIGNVGTSWAVVGTGDFNGDGKADILWRDTSGNLAVWLMNGAQITSSINIGNLPTTWSVAGTGDFNGDGKADILWRDTSGNIALWTMNGGTVTSAVSIGNVPTNFSIVGVGDFNDDGKRDILWRDTSGNTSIWFMNGGQVLSTTFVSSVPTSWSIAETGDFNGDSMSDLLWHDTSGNTAIWMLRNGSPISSALVGNVPTVWSIQNLNVD